MSICRTPDSGTSLRGLSGRWFQRWRAAAVLVSLLLSLLPGSAAPDGTEGLAQGFRQPPAAARPWVYWFWINGNITRAGITADLEAMKQAGLGGAVLLDAAPQVPSGPIQFGSAEWRQLFHHAVTEAGRLGLEIHLHNAPGWTGSGGPWMPPELGMQQLFYTRTNLVGPAHFVGQLPRPSAPAGPSRDVAILAFPSLVGEGGVLPGFAPKLTASVSGPFAGTNLLDHNPATHVTLPAPAPGKPQFLQLEFAEVFSASHLTLACFDRLQSFQGVLQVSDDGRRFRDVREFINRQAILSLDFASVSARYYRLLFTQAAPNLARLDFSELELTPTFRIDSFPAKAGLARWPLPGPQPAAYPKVPACGTVAPDQILDLTSRIGPEGQLDWDVPPGPWTVMRFGYGPTGRKNHPTTAGGGGLECDKLSREAIDFHFNALLGRLLSELGPEEARAFTATHVDSWEIGHQNWTPRFREEFQKRRGYDLLRYLPAASGRIVGSREVSERFFWDMRRTIADLLTENYAGRLAELAHQHHLQLSVQAYASLGFGPFDDLAYANRADIPMCEFWRNDTPPEQIALRNMTSAGHTSGKSIIAAEAFTSYPEFGKWQVHPFALKPLGDVAFCEGVNRMAIHCFPHQPWPDRPPGMTLGPFGLNYGRTDTWWEQSKTWHDYLARCQYLLQRGLFVADLCYLTDEGAYTQAPTPDTLQPPPPPGYNYDIASPEVVLGRLSVQGGRLVLPDAMSYRLLVLPPTDRMTPRMLRRVKELVEAGATVWGPPPARSPSLTDYPQCDTEVTQLAKELWGACDGRNITEHSLGQGKVVWGQPLETFLAQAGVRADFKPLTHPADPSLRCIHRRFGTTDIYFVASSRQQPMTRECLFRVTGKQPELWHPDTGQIEPAPIWREQDGGTVLPLQFAPAGSVFVVFRDSASRLEPATALTRNGESDASAEVAYGSGNKLQVLAFRPGLYQCKTRSGQQLEGRVQALPQALKLAGPWQVQFPPNAGAPPCVTLERLVSWTERPEPGVKYFSGTATYTTTLRLPAGTLAENRRWRLDLGRVEVIAQLKVNGQDFGILWKPPFEADITEALKPGENTLEIRVVNLWPNRLIGDEQLPEDCQWRLGEAGSGLALAEWPAWLLAGRPSPTGRLTFATWKHWTKDSPLLKSGLLGPVILRPVQRLSLE